MPAQDPIHDLFRTSAHPLDSFFKPRTVALIGATDREGSVGRSTLVNLLQGSFAGRVYPVNPARKEILGVPAFRSVAEIPEAIDLAVIVTPAATVPGLVQECVDAGVPAAIIISAGFKEKGERGAMLEKQIQDIARGRMRIIGPNCLGLISPLAGLNASFAQTSARPGPVAFLSQSGALCTAILDWSLQGKVGFSAFVSVGSMSDVGWGDLIDYFGDDPDTKCIVIYMESVGAARAFLSAAREVSLNKPILVLKAGRTEAAAKAAASHTGSLTGSDAVLDAAFRRSGVLRVDQISDLFSVIEVLAKQPLPEGPRLGILTNAGGPGVMAVDALSGLETRLAELSASSLDELNSFLPAHWSRANPVDILGDADVTRYSRALDVLLQDPEIDGLLILMTPQGVTPSADIAKAVTERRLHKQAQGDDKPVLTCWMGGPQVAVGRALLQEAGVPSFAYPEEAVRSFNLMWRYRDRLKGLYETPSAPPKSEPGPQENRIREIVAGARRAGRKLLTEFEAKRLLEAAGFPALPMAVAETAEQAVQAARAMEFPVVLKLNSKTVTHKSDVGGVQLNLTDEGQVRAAFGRIRDNLEKIKGPGHFDGVSVQPMMLQTGVELIMGSSVDPQFGPVLLFGFGGKYVEIFKDQTLDLPPLNMNLARRMIERTQVRKILQGARGQPPVNQTALEGLLVKLSELVLLYPEIAEIEINPLVASGDGFVALDARVVLSDETHPTVSSAIRPYPFQYVKTQTLGTGELARFRPIRPEDEEALIRFHRRLSERSVLQRYLQPLNLQDRTAHERLLRVCFADHDRQIVVVAEHESEIVAVGRLTRKRSRSEAELTLLVEDGWQNKGLGTSLMDHLMAVARQEKLVRVTATLSSENTAMRDLCERSGFQVEHRDGGWIQMALRMKV